MSDALTQCPLLPSHKWLLHLRKVKSHNSFCGFLNSPQDMKYWSCLVYYIKAKAARGQGQGHRILSSTCPQDRGDVILLGGTPYLYIFWELTYASVCYLLWNGVTYGGEILHADACCLHAGHGLGFMSIGVIVTIYFHQIKHHHITLPKVNNLPSAIFLTLCQVPTFLSYNVSIGADK